MDAAPRWDVRVLKMEAMPRWYPPLVRELGIRRSVLNSTTWKSKGGCFFKPPGVSCTDALREVNETHQERGAAAQQRQCDQTPIKQQDPRTSTGRSSNTKVLTNACGRLIAFYTPELADLVTDMFSEDLSTLGYGRWRAAPGTMPPF